MTPTRTLLATISRCNPNFPQGLVKEMNAGHNLANSRVLALAAF